MRDAEGREGDPSVTHCLMPNMGYACGGTILTLAGHFTVGPFRWAQVTCPECREHGYDRLVAFVKYQQGRGPHPDDVQLEAPEPHPVTAGEQVALW